MSSILPPVPLRIQMYDQGGFLSPIWADWFQKVFVRAGGSIAETNDELYDITSDRIPNGAVTLPKIQDIATDKLIGRDTAGTGTSEQIGVSGGIEFDGSLNLRTSAFTGDVTKTAGGTVQTIANDAVSFIKLLSTDWTSVKAASGYQKLPSGVYIQWGVTGSIASGTNTSVSFPIAFPTACRQVIPGIQGNSAVATSTTGHFGADITSASAFTLNNRTSSAYTFSWIAVGN